MGQGVGGVLELVDVEAPAFARDPLRHVLIIFGMPLADVRPSDHHLRAECLEVEDLFLTHLVGNDQDKPVALLTGHQRQPEPGISGGCFHERSAGLQATVLLRRLDHGKRDSVLDRTARILAFQFQEQLTRPGIEVVHPDDRSMADQFEYVPRGDRHVLRSFDRSGPRVFDRPRREEAVYREWAPSSPWTGFKLCLQIGIVKNCESLTHSPVTHSSSNTA